MKLIPNERALISLLNDIIARVIPRLSTAHSCKLPLTCEFTYYLVIERKL